MADPLEDPLISVEMQPAPQPSPLQKTNSTVQGRLSGNCIHCGVAMGSFLGTMSEDGPLHNECIPMYKKGRIERCAHCDCVLRNQRTIVSGNKLHPECVTDFKAKKPFVPPKKQSMVKKFAVGRSTFGKKNWKDRFFVLSRETNLSYYESAEAFHAGNSPKGVVVIDSTTRLITKPTRSMHIEALNPSKELLIMFTENGKPYKLLFSCSNWAEHEEWARALEFYVKIVDDPKDYVDPPINKKK